MIKNIFRKFTLLTMMVLAVVAVGFQLYEYSEPSAQSAGAEAPDAAADATVAGPVPAGQADAGVLAAIGPQSPGAEDAAQLTLVAATMAGATGAATTSATDGVATAALTGHAPNAAASASNTAGAQEDDAAGRTRNQAGSVTAPPARLQMMAGQEIRAQLSPRRYTTLATEIGARIRRLPVVESGRFRSGHLLVSLDCSIQKAQLDRSHAEKEASEKILAANEQLDEFHSIGKLDLETSRAAFAKAKADVAVADAALKKCDIYAPYDGRIAEMKVREQQYVQPGQPLMEILDDSTLELEFIVPSHWLAWLKPGQRFHVTIDETGRTYPARFTRVGAKVDPASMSVKVAGQIDGSHADLIAGMSGLIAARPPENARPKRSGRPPPGSAGAHAERSATEL